MDAPPETPAEAGVETAVTADAYQLFWDCVENDTPTGRDVVSTDADATDAYRQFWEVNDI